MTALPDLVSMPLLRATGIDQMITHGTAAVGQLGASTVMALLALLPALAVHALRSAQPWQLVSKRIPATVATAIQGIGAGLGSVPAIIIALILVFGDGASFAIGVTAIAIRMTLLAIGSQSPGKASIPGAFRLALRESLLVGFVGGGGFGAEFAYRALTRSIIGFLVFSIAAIAFLLMVEGGTRWWARRWAQADDAET